jgi:hypothetical protein
MGRVLAGIIAAVFASALFFYSISALIPLALQTDTNGTASTSVEAPAQRHDADVPTEDFSNNIAGYGWRRTGVSMSTIAAAGAPIEISTIKDLQKIGNDPAYPVDGYYILTADIDASETSRWNRGAGFDPIGKVNDEKKWNGFSGWFDGRGHKITGIKIQRPEQTGVGLFSSLSNTAVVVNVIVENGYFFGKNYVGALAGESVSNGVSACYSNGIVKGTSRVGGLIGINRGIIDACYSAATVTGENRIGGLVGRNWKGVISESYAAGNVSGQDKTLTGGLVGQNDSSVVRNSFWAIDLTDQDKSAGGTGLSSDKMKARAPFDEAGWDFTGMWTLIPGRSMPMFQFQQ